MDVLLHRIGWSVQVPARRAAERNEEKIAGWREETWLVIKGQRRTWAPRLCFQDESGQGLRPPKGRTWGRRGRTPVRAAAGPRSHAGVTAAQHPSPGRRGTPGRPGR